MSQTVISPAQAREQFVNEIKPVWCPGCGDFEVLSGLAYALASAGKAPHEVAVVSGIGCSSRLPGYMSTYGFNSIHGRPLPIATGLKLARPDLTVVVVSGDGDAFSIGGNHLIHSARRNVDITMLVLDNGIYGLTKGQVSPTTPSGVSTKTTDLGNSEMPLNPLELMLAFGAGFVAQAYSADPRSLPALIAEGLAYPGFSFVNIISPCPTFRGGMGVYKEARGIMNMLQPANGPQHDPEDIEGALRLAREPGRMHVGTLYRRPPQASPPEEDRSFDPQQVEAIAENYR
jgi:2-oxoglutarate ferredoxin oxidoreductase subunit beta